MNAHECPFCNIDLVYSDTNQRWYCQDCGRKFPNIPKPAPGDPSAGGQGQQEDLVGLGNRNAKAPYQQPALPEPDETEETDEAMMGGLAGHQDMSQQQRTRRPTSATQQLAPGQAQTPWDARAAQQRDRRPTAEELTAEDKVRAVIRQRIKEVVRKKPGGGGYVLYSPNQGKKKPPKPVGEFPTKLAAKKAELARFPPKDTEKLRRARKGVERMSKDPKKRAAQAAGDMGTKKPKKSGAPKKEPTPKKESVLRQLVREAVNESLFMEEPEQSRWDERIGRIPQEAIEGDSKLKKLISGVAAAQRSYLTTLATRLASGLRKAKVKAKPSAVTLKDTTPYVQVSLEADGVSLGAVNLYLDPTGSVRLEPSAEFKAGLQRVEPQRAKAVRGEVSAFADEVQDERGDSPVVSAISARDKYLDGLEKRIDSFMAKLDPLGVSLAKGLLVRKYRGRR